MTRQRPITARLSPCSLWLKRLASLGLVGLACPACDVVTITPHFNPQRNELGEKIYATLYFKGKKDKSDMESKPDETKTDEQEEKEDAPKMKLARTDQGYALKANLDHSDERNGDFVIMKHDEFKWFAGVRWRFDF